MDAHPHQRRYLLELIMIHIWKFGKSGWKSFTKLGMMGVSSLRNTDTGGDATHGFIRPGT